MEKQERSVMNTNNVTTLFFLMDTIVAVSQAITQADWSPVWAKVGEVLSLKRVMDYKIIKMSCIRKLIQWFNVH